MKNYLVLAGILLITTSASAENAGMNCALADKQLNLIKSQLDMVKEKHKISIKQSVQPQIQAQGGKQLNINIDQNNELVKAIAKLSIAEATFEAVVDMCKDGTLKQTSDKIENKNPDNYTATLIPKPETK